MALRGEKEAKENVGSRGEEGKGVLSIQELLSEKKGVRMVVGGKTRGRRALHGMHTVGGL